MSKCECGFDYPHRYACPGCGKKNVPPEDQRARIFTVRVSDCLLRQWFTEGGTVRHKVEKGIPEGAELIGVRSIAGYGSMAREVAFDWYMPEEMIVNEVSVICEAIADDQGDG